MRNVTVFSIRSSGTRTVCAMLQSLGYELVKHRYECHDAYAEPSPSEENCATRIHNITNDLQMTKYPVIVPLRHPGRSLATGGLNISTDVNARLKAKNEYKIESRLDEFDRFRDCCKQIEERGEILYFPIDADLSEALLFQKLLAYTGAKAEQFPFPQRGRTGKGDVLFIPDRPAMTRAVEFYDSRVERVRGSLNGA